MNGTMTMRTKMVIGLCALLAIAVPAMAVGVTMMEQSNVSANDAGAGESAGGDVNTGDVSLPGDLPLPDGLPDVNAGLGDVCSALQDANAPSPDAKWDIIAGGPEGDHATMDIDGSTHCTPCGYDAKNDVDLLGDEGQTPSIQHDEKTHVDDCLR